MTNLDSILKSRDITLPTKVCLVKAVVFPVVMYGCESWTINKAESWRIDAFELCCWRRLRSPLDCKEIQPVHPKGNQSRIHWKDWCWSRSSNTLATWCEELTHWKKPWCWERLKAGGEGDDRGWDGWMAPPTQWTWVWVSSRSWWWTGKPGMPWGCKESDTTEHLNWPSWTLDRDLILVFCYQIKSASICWIPVMCQALWIFCIWFSLRNTTDSHQGRKRCCCSVAKSCPTLHPLKLQHARPPCRSLSPMNFAQVHVPWIGNGLDSMD